MCVYCRIRYFTQFIEKLYFHTPENKSFANGGYFYQTLYFFCFRKIESTGITRIFFH
jgi:hypothetical protein